MNPIENAQHAIKVNICMWKLTDNKKYLKIAVKIINHLK